MKLGEILIKIKAEEMKKNPPYIFPISPSFIDELGKVYNKLTAFQEENLKNLFITTSNFAKALEEFSRDYAKYHKI
jgi:hypothetical protein